MSGEFLSPELEPLAQRPSLAELSQALHSLRERLSCLEHAWSQSASSGRADPAAAPDGDPQVLAVVQDILCIPSSGLHPAELFTLAIDRVSRLCAADRAMLFVAEAGGSRLVPRSAHGFRREDLESISIQPGEGIVGLAFKERRVLTYTGGGDGEAPDSFIDRFPVRDAIAVPVRAEDEVAGVLYSGRRRPGAPFSAYDVLLLLVIADRVGGGLVHQALLDRRARHVARLKELGAFAGRILSALPLADTLAEACEVGCRLVDVRAAAVAVAAEAGALELVAARGLPGAMDAWRRVDSREGLTAELGGGDGPVACRDVQSRPVAERSFLGDGGFHGCLLLPLRVRGSPAGVLYLTDTEVRDFSGEEIEVAQVLAAMVASAIEQSQVTGELRTALEDARATHERLVQIEKARVLGEMAGGLARELNNIFAIILGKSRLLLARTHDEPLREGLGLVEDAAWRGADVVHRLTGLAGPTSGEAAGTVDLTALVQDALAQARPRCKDEPEGRGAPVDIVTDLRSSPSVRGNATALRDALVSLVLNAVDAMPHGGRLHLATRARDAGVELTLTDTGEGIPEDLRSRVFDPFFTTRSATRMGLGLTVAHGVVTRYGGRIEISGGPGRGTRVTIWLPAAETAAPPSAHGTPRPAAAPDRQAEIHHAVEPHPGASAGEALPVSQPAVDADRRLGAKPSGPSARSIMEPPSETASILVLEDDAPIRSLLTEALTQAGHKVETAVDGPSGLAKLEGAHFDVVLTDLALPQISGLAIARAVKRLHPHTPVVLITGWGHLLDPERLREHGVDLMLVKPFRPERVLSVVGDALRLRISS